MPAMEDAASRAVQSARELARRIGHDHHDVLIVLGTGISTVAEILGAGEDSVALDTLPFYPSYTAGGHRAHAWSVPTDGRRVLVLGGRCHLYEGLTPAEVVHPVRMGIATGCTTVILTAATGAIRADLPTGSLMVVEDHLNLTGQSPLSGPTFVDLADAYAPHLRSLALATPEAGGTVSPRPGVYAQVAGPQLETPAEIRMLRAHGADVVGMSMALETIAARAAGAQVLGLAIVSNPAAAPGATIDMADVTAIGAATAPAVAAVVRHVIGSVS
jgi:purine-nucleoside phosphorylase